MIGVIPFYYHGRKKGASFRGIVCPFWFAVMLWSLSMPAATLPRHPLDPRGRMHMPIGLADTVDRLKTFVEAEGNFSPGVGSYGLYFWVWDPQTQKLYAPTMEGVAHEHGLGKGGALIPWTEWEAGRIRARTEVCEVEISSPSGPVFVAAARVRLFNPSGKTRIFLYAALRPLGSAGWPVKKVAATEYALLAEGRCALTGPEKSSQRGAALDAVLVDLAMKGQAPSVAEIESARGEAAGLLRYDLSLEPAETRTLDFTCPVLPGRRVTGHRWDGSSPWAQYDLNPPNPAEGGVLQPDPGLAWYRKLQPDRLFREAEFYWQTLSGKVKLRVPDRRWSDGFTAMVSHCALNMNEGAPDVAVVNFNVFNRDGVYLANIFQKSGNFKLAETAIDYFLSHPFNGRVQPEADNPGQILWILGEHWLFTRDRAWLERIFPSARQLAEMIRYYRTTPGPHWVCDTSLDFGDRLPPRQRKELKPGACDGYHPAYTEAYDIAGLRAAALLADFAGRPSEALAWRQLSQELFRQYDLRFGRDLPKDYGGYCVLWPCRLYSLDQGSGYNQFRTLGAQKPADWRYFPLARAHQGLLAGNRSAGWETLQLHFDHPQMKGWYALDEGGPSGVGGWHYLKTSWPVSPLPWDEKTRGSCAMPHGWSIAEAVLLLRDCLMFEDQDRLVLFAGIPESWFLHPDGMEIENLPSHFGPISFAWMLREHEVWLRFYRVSHPPCGMVLRLPVSLHPEVIAQGRSIAARANGDICLPSGSNDAVIRFQAGQ